MTMVTLDDAKEASRAIVDKLLPVSVIVFGSVAKNGMGNDLDILIITKDNGRSPEEMVGVVYKILDPFYMRFSIDPIVLPVTLWKKHFLKGSPFLRLIQREGRVLYMENFVQQWFKQAREELRMAEYLLEGNYFTGACYHGQQSVEKSIKGDLLSKGWELEKIHRIKRLVVIAREYDIPVEISEDDIIFLDSIYRGRYPAEEGLLPLREPTKEDAEGAVKLAKGIYEKLAKEE